MAKQIVFGIYDTKAESYLPPFTAPAVGLGIRIFTDACTDPSSPISKHKSDYRLYRIGEFDDSDGSIVSAIPTVLCTGDEVGGTRDIGKRVVSALP